MCHLQEVRKEASGTANGSNSQLRVAGGFPGADGLVRKARIKTATSVYDRPIQKLCLITTKQELNNEQ